MRVPARSSIPTSTALLLLVLAAACGSEASTSGFDGAASGADPSGAAGAGAPREDAGAPARDASTGSSTSSCESACLEGTRSCEGAAVATCVRSASGCTAWSPVKPCGSGEVCSDGSCIRGCTSRCTEGAVQCSATANGVSTCTKQASGCTDWSTPVACTSPEVCSGGRCVLQCTNQCTVGSTQCSGSGVATCAVQASGCTDWNLPVDCQGGKVCSGGQCVAQCQNQCSLGAKQCAGLGDAVATCVMKASGCTDWDTPAPCNGSDVCSAGQCVPACYDECALGAEQCAGVANALIKCVTKASGCTGWDTPAACAAGTTCAAGKCTPTCVNQCTLGFKQCAANGAGVSTCETKPSGCTDWGAPVSCGAGAVCAGGMCQASGPVSWKVVPSSTARHLRDVWGSGPNDVWAVGEGGTILHHDGNAWSGVSSNTVRHLGAVWGSGPSDVWAVAQEPGTGTADILHYDGAQWTASKPLPSVLSFADIWGSGPSDVWVVGAAQKGNDYVPVAGHFDGATWSLLPSGNPKLASSPYAVWTSGPNDVWIATGNLVHFDGANWTQHGGASALSISGTGPGDVWFAQSYSGIARSTGGAVTPVTSPIIALGHWRGVFVRTPSDAWMVGDGGRITHFDGATWSVDTRTAAVPAVTLRSVWASGPTDAWAVGDQGTIVHLAP